LKALETIARVAAKIAPGRSPLFSEAHIVEALEKISNKGNVGRLNLSKDLQLGEGEVRTLVKHLDKEGLIEVSRSGISLSKAGKKLLLDLRNALSPQVEVSSSPLTVGLFNVAVQVKGMKTSVRYGLEQRDAAKRAGAEGATTLVFTKNRLIMPGTGEPMSETCPSVAVALSKLSLREGDVVIIGSANERFKAGLGAKTAALELLKTKYRAHPSGNTD